MAMSQGCPELPIRTALELIEELEEAHRIKVRKLNTSDELEYVRKVIEEHPVFRDLPWHVKKELLVQKEEVGANGRSGGPPFRRASRRL